jgi:hypothetical protein
MSREYVNKEGQQRKAMRRLTTRVTKTDLPITPTARRITLGGEIIQTSVGRMIVGNRTHPDPNSVHLHLSRGAVRIIKPGPQSHQETSDTSPKIRDNREVILTIVKNGGVRERPECSHTRQSWLAMILILWELEVMPSHNPKEKDQATRGLKK